MNLFTKLTALCIICLFTNITVKAQINTAHRQSSNAYRNNYQRIGSGAISESTFEIKADGSLWAWGYNGYGQLGDATTTYKSSPIQIGTDTKWVGIGSGFAHTTAIKSDGTLWSWGWNGNGQLGDGTTTDKSSPLQIGSDNKWISVAPGAGHTIALKSDGTLWGWGNNNHGQVGDGTTTQRNSPVQIGTDNKWVTIAVGSSHSYGIKSDGTLWVWGSNQYGQLGEGTTTDRTSPVQIGADDKWRSIAVGQLFSIAIKSDGTLWAWGKNDEGELGDGTFVSQTSPIQIGTDNKWTVVAAGSYHSIAIKSDGTLWTWGDNGRGELGDGTTTIKTSPIQIGTDTKWVGIVGGFYQTTALKSDGTLWATGYNFYGEIGDGTTTQKTSLIQISVVDSRILSVACGGRHTIAVKTDGTLWGWGSDYPLGYDAFLSGISAYSPYQIGTDNKWVSVAAGLTYSIALKSDGTLWTWGANYYGQLGDGTTSEKTSPIQIGTDTKWVSVAAGQYHTLALKSDGTLWAWGFNQKGQLGDGTTSDKNIPTQIGTDTKWVSVAAGEAHTIALKSDGTLWVWGSNQSGQLTNYTYITPQINSPTQIGTDTNWVSMAAGGNHNVALKSDGTLWVWGLNNNHQCYGDFIGGYSYPVYFPSQINYPITQPVVSVSAGYDHTTVILSGGSLWAWGNYSSGQLGTGFISSYFDYYGITQIGSQTNVLALAQGSMANHTVILKADRRSVCLTGYNQFGQLGNGTSINSYTYDCISSFYAPLTWTGTSSTAWATAYNWNTGAVPTSVDNPIIINTTNAPIVSDTQAINNLTINTGASLTVTGSLQVGGSISNSGTLTATSGTIKLNGTIAQTIAASTFAGNTVQNLTVNNAAGVTLGGALNVTGTLTPTSGTLTTGGFLTLKSDATGTARIAPVVGAITGNVTVERYIPAGKRSFRLLTPAVTTSNFIKGNWQEGANNTSLLYASNQNPVVGYGTHITGSATGLNGFDATSTGNASLFQLNNSTQAWAAIANTNATNLTAGNAYRLLVRGSRSFDLSTTLATNTATTLRATGTLLTGSMTFGSASSTPASLPTLATGIGQYSFIGNPYASPIDWNALTRTELTGFYWIWDPTLATNGAYVSCSTTGVKSNGSSAVTTAIQPGQAFFVVNSSNAAARSLVITEANKTTGNTNVFRTETGTSTMAIQLFLTSNINGTSQDGANVLFNSSYSNAVNDDDAGKFVNLEENIAVQRGSNLMSIETRDVPVSNDTVQLKAWQLTQNNYTLRIASSNFDAGMNAYLQDAYLNNETQLNLTGITDVNFTTSPVASSTATDRFRIVFRSNGALPVSITSLKAYQKNAGVQVEWNTVNETNMATYEVEKSIDGASFSKAGTVSATGASAYNWYDAGPVNGSNYYRIKLVDKNGTSKYTQVVNVKIGGTKNTFTIVGNPVKSKLVTLQMENVEKGSYGITVFNNLGQTIASKTIKHAGGSATETIALGNAAAGTYQLSIIGNNVKEARTIIVE